ncbi:MAG: SPOR domain-containing protein [Candidatus Acidiferrum sp.]
MAAASIQAPLKEKLVSTAGVTAPKSYGVKIQNASPASSSLSVPVVKPSDTPALSSTTGRPLSPGNGIAPPASDPITSLIRSSAPEKELANRPAVHFESSKVEGTVMRSEKYLDVGRFKQKLLADKTTVKLSELGFPAAVIQWNRFWGRSYQVLVGPYGGDSEAEAAHKDLTSLGFTPRSYERGRRDFRLPPALKVDATHLPVGDCTISWESYTPDAIVKFQDDRGRSVTVEGKWVKQGVRYSVNEVGYETNRDGSHSLIEIHFAGMGQALFFTRN